MSTLATLLAQTTEIELKSDDLKSLGTAIAFGLGVGLGAAGAGIGLSSSWLGVWAIPSGILAGISVAAIFSLRIGVEIKAGKEYVEQPNFLGFEPEDTLYIVGPVTWLGFLGSFVIAAGIGTPLFLLYVLWQSRRQLAAAGKKGQSG